MRRPILITLLVIGTIGGFAAGFARLSHYSWHRHQHFEQHVADVCVAAAHRAMQTNAASSATP